MHLKEYSAEIESLRAQLQTTREKNGVYLDPKDFYDMENKIASLGMQLAECETVLKSRNEEVVLLRESNDHMQMKIQSLSTALDTANTELLSSKNELDHTKECLNDTIIELRATESVITEQVKTERSLTAEATGLQNEIQQYRKSILSLHDKIDLYATIESDGESRTKSFVEDLLTSQSALLMSLEALRQGSGEKSAAICVGIQDLLLAGRNACADLKRSIDQALEVLIGDTDKGKSLLDDKLSVLKEQLNLGRVDLLDQLSKLQQELGQSMHRMTELVERSSQLHSEMELGVGKIVENVQTDLKGLTSLTSSFVFKQDETFKRQLRQSDAITHSLKEKLEVFKDGFRNQQKDHDKVVEIQTERMQQV